MTSLLSRRKLFPLLGVTILVLMAFLLACGGDTATDEPEPPSTEQESATTAADPTPEPTATPEASPPPEPTVASTLTDREILEVFYHATGGPNWVNNANWLSDRPIGEWYGVTTDADGYVTDLDFFDEEAVGGLLSAQQEATNKLKGEIPGQIGRLSRLKNLDLRINELSGEIPPELGSLASLEQMILHSNQLTGEIPRELANLSQLTGLSFSGNQLSGEIPPELSRLSLLKALNLGGNRLTGKIPSELGNLSNLKSMWLHRNQLSGPIPLELGQLTGLEALELTSNQLSGELPEAMASLTSLTRFALGSNQFTGYLPPWLGSLPELYHLSLAGNRLNGGLPTELGNLTKLQSFYLDYNQLSGPIPQEWGNMSSLRAFKINGNSITGCLPAKWLGQVDPNYGSTDVAGLPFCDASQGSTSTSTTTSGSTAITADKTHPPDREALEALYHATGGPNWTNNTNWLSTAPVSEWYGIQIDENGRVFSIDLSNNGLRGEIPPQLSSLEGLFDLRLGGNQLRGPIPAELGQLTNLVMLLLEDNQLSGRLPSELRNLANLWDLYLSENQLSGEVPYWLGEIGNLWSLALDRNRFSGEIPPELGKLARLEILSLSHNDISGEIPPDLANLSKLAVFEIRYNQLTGEIPQAFENHPIPLGLYSEGNQFTGCISNRLRQLLTRDSSPGLPDCAAQVSSQPRPARPDLVVLSVGRGGGTDAVFAGQALTLQAEVANTGDGPASSTTLRYYHSNDATISSRDSQVGTDLVTAVQPGRNSPQSIQITAPASPGTYYYGACVDAVSGESDATNNCSSAVSVSIGTLPKPDLVVRNVARGGSASIFAGQPFGLQAEVNNIGDAAAGSTVLRFYLSNDQTINSRDSQVGTARVGTVQPGGTSPQSIQMTAPASPGTYYYGACVDAVSGESDATNNCSSAVSVSIGTLPKPDLVVRNVARGGSASIFAGQPFGLQAEVNNIGDAAAGSTVLRFYLSNDQTINSRDSQVGTARVGTVQPGGTSPQSIQMTAPASPGTYYYGACVDAVSGESDATNNCSSAVSVSIGTLPKPDLVVRNVARGGSASIFAGQPFGLQAEVNNIGDAAAGSTVLRFYLSNDQTINSRDSQVGTARVGTVQPGGTSPQSIQMTAPASPGTYYYGACVDAVSGESDATNNCSSAVSVSIGTLPKPDLVVRNVARGGSASIFAGQPFGLQAEVNNIGDAAAGSTVLRFYLSNDQTINSRDSQVGTARVGTVQPGGTSPQSIQMTAPASPGTYYYGACVDAVSGESDATNNCSSAVSVSIGTLPKPDLVVRSVDRMGSGPVYAGQQFTLQATVVNNGDGEAASATLRYFRSSDSNISASDSPVGSDSVGTVQPARSSPQSTPVTAPTSPGIYYYGACVDDVSGESNTSNNCSQYVRVNVVEPAKPDLVITQFRTDEKSVEPGASAPLTLTIRNQGNGRSEGTHVTFYISQNSQVATTSSNQMQYGRNIRAFDPSPDQQVLRFSIDAPDQSGTYYIRVCIYALRDESNSQNNCSGTERIEIQEPAAPDLVIWKFVTNEKSAEPGAQITFTVNVRNQGNSGSRSTSFTIWASQSPSSRVGALYEVDVPALGASPDDQEFFVQRTGPNHTGRLYFQACVDSVSGESNTDNNCSDTDYIDFQVTAKPDLITAIRSVGDAGIIYSGAEYKVRVGVRNYGNATSASTTLRFYRSDDRTISRDDDSLGSVTLEPLAPGASVDKEITRTAPRTSNAANYYYGCVDEGAGDPSYRCSALLKGEIREPIYIFNEKCDYSDDLVIDNFSFTAEIEAYTPVTDARVKGVFVIFLLGIETSRISVDEGFGSLRQNQTKEITINRRVVNPTHIFSTAECRFTLDWSY